MKMIFKGRPIEVSVDSNSGAVEDAYIAEAYWLDGEMLPLTDDELERATSDCAAEIDEYWRECMLDRFTAYE